MKEPETRWDRKRTRTGHGARTGAEGPRELSRDACSGSPGRPSQRASRLPASLCPALSCVAVTQVGVVSKRNTGLHFRHVTTSEKEDEESLDFRGLKPFLSTGDGSFHARVARPHGRVRDGGSATRDSSREPRVAVKRWKGGGCDRGLKSSCY